MPSSGYDLTEVNLDESNDLFRELKEIDARWGLAGDVLAVFIQGIREGDSVADAFFLACTEWDV